jgi:DNA-3-methyladenine glycosylase
MRARRPNVRRDIDLTNGPGKLCLALGITGEHTWNPLQCPPLLIRAGEPVADRDVTVTARIGITRWADAPLRWFVAHSRFVSKTPSHFPRRALSD